MIVVTRCKGGIKQSWNEVVMGGVEELIGVELVLVVKTGWRGNRCGVGDPLLPPKG